MLSVRQPVSRDIVLVGGGHSHVGVIRRFGMHPVPGVRLTVICRDTHTPYSGMLPGYIAGHYDFDQVHIDLRKLAQFAGARYCHDEVIGIDRDIRRVICRSRPSIAYDLLAINIGSAPQVQQVPGAQAHAVPVKPIDAFNARWLALLERVREKTGPMRIAVVGAGAGGVELTLAMHFRLRGELVQLGRDPDELRFDVYADSTEILPTHNERVRASYESILRERGVFVHLADAVVEVEAHALVTASGARHASDEVVWVTQAGGAAWLSETGLALDSRGFVRVSETLQTITDPTVFAAGDIASIEGHPLEKAGVFAVRQGRPLADNLRRAALGHTLRAYRPQQFWLALISTGDRYAVASRGSLALQGAWVWRWKDWIDRRFMRRFSELPVMSGEAAAGNGLRSWLTASRMSLRIPPAGVSLEGDEAAQALAATAMRCGGCGAKVGAAVLGRVMAALHPLQHPDVMIGLQSPDDAAVVRVPPGKALVHSIDFFRAFIDDPYLLGRIAANHALGDIYAMGAQPQSACAVVTVPPGLESKVEETLLQLMSGAVAVLNDAGCALVGGHTGEGSELAIGFSINGLVDETLAGVTRKSGMRVGDAIVLTKPIGTGTLFAANAQLAARGRWIDAALTSMAVSNREGAEILRAHAAGACTDVTGFGLLGHLVEMTRASGCHARLDLDAIPTLDGAEETARAGILSSLQPANLRLRRAVRNAQAVSSLPRYRLLFDPQTAGGLLASLPADQADPCCAALRAAGYASAVVIGWVVAANAHEESVMLGGY